MANRVQCTWTHIGCEQIDVGHIFIKLPPEKRFVNVIGICGSTFNHVFIIRLKMFLGHTTHTYERKIII